MLALVQKFDELNNRLYLGKITIGEFNVKRLALLRESASIFASVNAEPTNSTVEKSKPLEKAVSVAAQPPSVRETATLASANHEVRIALVIGQSNYVNLPKLINPASDARSIAEAFQRLGYNTKLVLDTSEDGIRKEFRKFASDSSRADVAVLFYAGHGAQLNGSNYLLPVDVDIPRTEADIQFSGLKVDDLVNGIGSNTKIVFLDACRDNPALFKNILKGRGASALGLAPASSANFPAKPGGGVFIAYATDAGAVADDGHGQHSPFTQALLRYMEKPVSIDDMFSLVTKEVRLVTKNTQRPYKYASLENIICLAAQCANEPSPAAADVAQQAKQSEDEELQIALRTNNSSALETYLQKYPESTNRAEVTSVLAAITRSQFTEWTLVEVINKQFPVFLQISSIRRFGDKVVVKTRAALDPSLPNGSGKDLPDAVYQENWTVFDCTKLATADAERSWFGKSGEMLHHFKWADPEYLDMKIGAAVPVGSVLHTVRMIACNEPLSTPMVTKSQYANRKFKSLSSLPSGDGEMFYDFDPNNQTSKTKEVVLLIINNADQDVSKFLPSGFSIPKPLPYRTEVSRVVLKCDKDEFVITKTEFWSASSEMVRLAVLDPEKQVSFSEFRAVSPFATLQKIVCPTSTTNP
jgi:uncharacterized caspase-like protein